MILPVGYVLYWALVNSLRWIHTIHEHTVISITTETNAKFMHWFTIIHIPLIYINIYHRWGKFCWAKLSRFWSYEVFCGNTFAVHWLGVLMLYKEVLMLNIHGKTFAVLFKTAKTTIVWPSKSFPVYGICDCLSKNPHSSHQNWNLFYFIC